MGYNKFNARGADYDGHHFDSQAELARYLELKVLESDHRIEDLKVHPKFTLLPAFVYNGKKERGVIYEADFEYIEFDEDGLPGARVIEDVKGMETKEFRIKSQFLKRELLDMGGTVEFRIIK